MVEWLSSWPAEQEVWGLIPGLTATISDIGYLLLPSHDTGDIPLKRRKFSIQPTNQLIENKVEDLVTYVVTSIYTIRILMPFV